MTQNCLTIVIFALCLHEGTQNSSEVSTRTISEKLRSERKGGEEIELSLPAEFSQAWKTGSGEGSLLKGGFQAGAQGGIQPEILSERLQLRAVRLTFKPRIQAVKGQHNPSQLPEAINFQGASPLKKPQVGSDVLQPGERGIGAGLHHLFELSAGMVEGLYILYCDGERERQGSLFPAQGTGMFRQVGEHPRKVQGVLAFEVGRHTRIVAACRCATPES